jgi:hypothetical protein
MFILSWFINVIPADTITNNEIVSLELKESQNKKEISCMSAKNVRLRDYGNIDNANISG